MAIVMSVKVEHRLTCEVRTEVSLPSSGNWSAEQILREAREERPNCTTVAVALKAVGLCNEDLVKEEIIERRMYAFEPVAVVLAVFEKGEILLET